MMFVMLGCKLFSWKKIQHNFIPCSDLSLILHPMIYLQKTVPQTCVDIHKSPSPVPQSRYPHNRRPSSGVMCTGLYRLTNLCSFILPYSFPLWKMNQVTAQYFSVSNLYSFPTPHFSISSPQSLFYIDITFKQPAADIEPPLSSGPSDELARPLAWCCFSYL